MTTTVTSENQPHRSLRGWLGLAGLLVVLVVVGMLLRAPHAATDPNDVLRDMIVRGIQDNVAKLSCVVLAWRSESRAFGPWSDKPERAGEHQLWWDGRRTAISYVMRSTTSDPNGQVSSDLRTRSMTYDGREFRWMELPVTPGGKAEMVIQSKPHYRPDENYLTEIGWLGRGLISRICVKSGPTEPGILRYSREGRLIKMEFHNSRTGQIGIWMYDPQKAYGLVTEENYARAGKMQAHTRIEYAQVPGGAWFPIRVATDGFNIQTGELLHRSKLEVDVGKSVFNDPAALPVDVFELKAGPNTEITDLTSLKTRVKMRLNDH